MNIIHLEEKHLSELTVLAQHTFDYSYQNFFKGHPDENDFKEYVSIAFTTVSFLSQIQNPACSFYGVFENEALIAYIKLNDEGAQNLKGIKSSLELERIYIHESQQGKGIGSTLISFCKKQAILLGKKSLWLLVWERNEKAIIFYEKMGFRITGNIPYKFDAPELDLILSLDL